MLFWLSLWHLKPCVPVIELHFMPLGWINPLLILIGPHISNDPWSCVSGCFLWLYSWLSEGYGEVLEGAAVHVRLWSRSSKLQQSSVTWAQSTQGFAEKCSCVSHWSGWAGFPSLSPSSISLCRGIWNQIEYLEKVLHWKHCWSLEQGPHSTKTVISRNICCMI